MTFRLFSVLAVVCGLHAAEVVVGGPYTVNVTPKSATVMWIVQSHEGKLGTTPDKWTASVPLLRSEKITYTGLKPGVTYHYEIAGIPNGKGSFKTAADGDVNYSFVVFGDTRTRHDMHARVIAAIEKAEPDFVVHTGDLVSDGTDAALWPRFFSIEGALLRRTPIYPVLGNHERNSPQYSQFFDVKLPYYSFDWGAVHFTMLNTDMGNMPDREAFWARQVEWFEQDLKSAQDKPLRMAVFHNPPFTAVAKRQKEGGLAAELVPLIEKYKVQAVFTGHDHNYQHHLKNGVRYVVTGGGGAPLYPVDGAMAGITQKVESTEHYVRIKVTGKTAVSEAVALDGRVIDTFEMR